METLLVVTILGLIFLAAFTWMNPKKQIDRGHDMRRKKDIATIERILEDYHNDHQRYPSEATMRVCPEPDPNLVPYAKRIPCDPDGSPYAYVLCNPSLGTRYTIYARISDRKDPVLREQPCGGGCTVNGKTYSYAVSSGGDLCGSPVIGPSPTYF